jgi:hypothetical protein
VSEFFLEILKSQGLFYGKFYGELYGAFVKRKILFFLSTKFFPEQIHGIQNPKLPNRFTESETPEQIHGIRNSRTVSRNPTLERFHGLLRLDFGILVDISANRIYAVRFGILRMLSPVTMKKSWLLD